MKAIVLAAGRGVRLYPLTNDTPKPLVEVNGMPFLYYVLKELEKAGFAHKDIGIIVCYKKEKVQEFIRAHGFNVTLIDQCEPMGTGHAVSKAEEFVGGENFIVLMGDNLYSADDISNISNDDDLCYIAGFHHGEPERFGVLVADDDNLIRIIEKPKEKIGDLINTGLYKFTSEVFGALKAIKKSERGEFELTDAINSLADEKKVMIVEIERWMDLGNINDIPKLEDFLRENWKE